MRRSSLQEIVNTGLLFVGVTICRLLYEFYMHHVMFILTNYFNNY